MTASFLIKMRNVAWGEPPASKLERKLLLKLDWFILSFICLMYFSNYLDRANLANAYVSGLKEAAGMVGSDLNKVNSMFTVGYVIGMIPQNLALSVIPPRILFPTNTVIWGVLTMCTSRAKNTHDLMAIRLLQGIAESSTFVGAHYIMGSWYRESELGKRSAIFAASGQLATLFSGVLQAAIYKNLNGKAGLAGYQWLFIICGVITLPIAFYGFFFFPDTPTTTKVSFLSQEERELAISRLPPKPVTKMDWSVIKRVLGRWHWYLLSLIWIVGGELESVGSNSLMALWMKSKNSTTFTKYSVAQLNYYPFGGTTIAIVALLATAVWTDYTRKRHHVNYLISVCLVVVAAIILAQPQATGALFFAFYLAGVSYAGQFSNFAWANEICRFDDQERGVVLASMNMWSNVFNAWWPLIFFKANNAPKWHKGMISLIVLAPIMVGLTWVTRYLQLRDDRATLKMSERVVEGDADDNISQGSKEGKVDV